MTLSSDSVANIGGVIGGAINAIGGGAKTTLVICCAPTMTDQFETIGSLDFGQQAMNVVVRAKVNASTDYASLTAEDPALLKQTVMVKLNGGLGTGMGLEQAKSLLELKGKETFLDFIAKQEPL